MNLRNPRLPRQPRVFRSKPRAVGRECTESKDMNRRATKLNTRFEEPTRFVAPVPFRGLELNELERLSERLLREALDGANGLEEPVLLRRAANDAASLAAVTAFPLLMFPGLFEEIRAIARAYASRQEAVRKRSRALMAFAE